MPMAGMNRAKQADDSKQPYFIHDNTGRLLMIAALTVWRPASPLDAAHGFAIVTDDAKGGMVGVHDRRLSSSRLT